MRTPAHRVIRLLVALTFVAALAAFFALGGSQYLSLESLRAHREALLGYADTHYWTLLLVAGLSYTSAVALSLPGAAVLSLAVGFLFGRWVGTALIILSATLGATLVFLAARYLFGEWARKRLEQSELGERILGGFQRNAFHYLLFLRLVPAFPFWLVNLASALTRIPLLSTYVSATAIGIVPGSFVFANLGQSLGRIESLHGLLSGEVIAALVLLGVLALLPVIFNRRRRSLASPS